MMMLRTVTTPLIGVLLMTVGLGACKKNGPFDEYEGSWKGSYTGDDIGQWEVFVDDNGEVTGTATSNDFQGLPFDIEGTVSPTGIFRAEAEVFTGKIEFDGTLNGSIATGTWRNEEDELEGTWVGAKQ